MCSPNDPFSTVRSMQTMTFGGKNLPSIRSTILLVARPAAVLRMASMHMTC